jgi:prephenate dehydrogenase (NADP+)
MVDCWHKLGIRPFDHLICQTPPFRLLLGITEYLFRDEKLLEQSIKAALFQKDIRADDCEFYTSAKGWVECIGLGNPEAYKRRFESTAAYFENRVQYRDNCSKLIERIAKKSEAEM